MAPEYLPAFDSVLCCSSSRILHAGHVHVYNGHVICGAIVFFLSSQQATRAQLFKTISISVRDHWIIVIYYVDHPKAI